MERQNSLDGIDKCILRILGLYERLDLIELLYEIGEDDTSVEDVTQEEVLHKLEVLNGKGFVERTEEPRGGVKWALNRRR